MSDGPPEVTVVVPTIGRPSLHLLLDSLRRSGGDGIAEVVVVDDRRSGPTLQLPDHAELAVRVLSSGGRGPAAARNRGWRAARTPWIAFLDDDVLVSTLWSVDLARDLSVLDAVVAASQGRVDVPLPVGRRPTDWERSTAGLATARWITADMAYRRSVLQSVGGFDERFPRAYREDADLAIRVSAAGFSLTVGERRISHPVRPADRWVSVRAQAGNADDVLMRRLHGRRWRDLAGAEKGRRPRHIAVTAAGVAALAALGSGHRRVAAVAAGAWLGGTAELAAARIAPGPRDRSEVSTMLLTSAAIPPAAVWHAARGLAKHRAAQPWRPLPDAVLFDRDGTLVVDVPYNGDPALVRPVPGARAALDRLRAAGLPVGVVTNQSGIGRGRLTRAQVDAVNGRVEQLLGPFDVWQVCPHDVGEGCACRKPAPGMVHAACAALGADPERTVLIGDIGSDVDAAAAAGSTGIIVPTQITLPDEVGRAAHHAADLAEATDLILQGAW